MSGEQSTGKIYNDGEIILEKGERAGGEAYEIQSGKVRVVDSHGGKETVLAVLHEGEIFGEMCLLSSTCRTATIKAVGTVRVVAFDKEAFLERLREEPEFALTLLKRLTERVTMTNNLLNTVMGILKDVQGQNVGLKEKMQAQTDELEKTLNKLQSGQ
ncbi:MAG: cyclic nucleotide-binding domain-containing protein [Candidatus Brocadiales bacterium]